MAASVLPWLTIATAAEPELVALIQSLLKLKTKYPALTPDQIMSLVQQATTSADADFNAALAKIAADQKGA